MDTINGLDFCIYQEQPEFGKLINYKALKADPLSFRFCWIKSSEGELLPTDKGAYPVLDFKRQVEGARSVGFEQVNPYHFYYYHVPQGDGKFYILSPQRQAEAFAASCEGFEFDHPMTDCEDPFVDPFLQWSNTETANVALAFARKLNLHLKTYHAEVTKLLGRPDIYTGDWWWKKMANLLLLNGFTHELVWANDYKFIVANYTGKEPIVPPGIVREQVIAWQYTSTPKVAIQGIPVGMIGPGLNVDLERWVGTEAQWNEWVGKAPIPPVEAPPEPITLEKLAQQFANLDGRVKKIEALPWYRQFFPIVDK